MFAIRRKIICNLLNLSSLAGTEFPVVPQLSLTREEWLYVIM